MHNLFPTLKQKLSPLFQKIKEYYSIDTRALAVFRIGIALMILADLLLRLRDIGAFYDDSSALPREFVIKNYTIFSRLLSIHLLHGSLHFQLVLFFLAGVFSIALLVGYRTRFVTIVSWLLLVSLQIRGPVIIHGADVLLRFMLFWGIFLPLGSRYSLDEKLNTPNKKSVAGQISSLGTLALFLQVGIV
ncbi:MAG: HTTM domain-containing protein, partial [Patescibacteria group bacterium]|nr:HTTM domain-containing protein [Patescibacteria group bacterium]